MYYTYKRAAENVWFAVNLLLKDKVWKWFRAVFIPVVVACWDDLLQSSGVASLDKWQLIHKLGSADYDEKLHGLGISRGIREYFSLIFLI